MKSYKDDRGFNQIWVDAKSTRIRASRRCDYMISHMQPAPGKSVLEVGCGTGEICRMLAERTGMNVLGVDFCTPFIDKAKQRNTCANASFQVADVNRTSDFGGQVFDYIVGNGVLHHLYYTLNASLKNLKSLLKPGGRLIFMEPNLKNPYVYCIFSYDVLREKASLEPAEMAFTKKFAEKQLQEAGFRGIKVEYKDFLLPGVPDCFINPLIIAGDVLERTPLRVVSQSLGIVANNCSEPTDPSP